MKTIEFNPGPDHVIEEVIGPDGQKLCRVKRKVAFLTEPAGNFVSTVAAPANGAPFAAIKAEGAVPAEPPASETDNAAEEPMGGVKTELTEAEKASLWDRFVGSLKGIFAPADANKSVPTVTIDQQLARDKFREDWRKLKWAFDDVTWDLLWNEEVEGDRGALLNQACDDFCTKAKALLALRPLMALKAEKAADGKVIDIPDPEYAAMTKAAKDVAEKAGKVISSANMAHLQAMQEALGAILAAAAPPAAAPEATTDEAAGKGAAPATPPAPGATEGDSTTDATGAAKSAADQEQAMDAEKTKKLQDLVAAAKAATTPEERAAKMAELEEAIKGKEPTLAEQVQAAVKAEMDCLKGDLANVLKAIAGMDEPGDPGPEDQALARRLAGAPTPDDAARNPGLQEKGPAGNGLGTGPAHPGNPAVPVGLPSTKSAGEQALAAELAALKTRLAAVEGARPAGLALPAEKTAPGGTGGGWSAGTGLFA